MERRSSKWRERVGQLAEAREVLLEDRFSIDADVHVFIMAGVRSQGGSRANWIEVSPDDTVGSHFNVSVGAVVEHRRSTDGETRPYLTPEELPAHGEVLTGGRTRGWEGRLRRAPFVAVRRTSRPGDPVRAVSTVVAGSDSYAVENHVMVLSPTHGGVDSCRELQRQLRSDRATSWLNRRIRCRHLTVSALQELPWEANDGL